MDQDYIIERSEIPQSLIDECEKLSIDNDETYFIFDNPTSLSIKILSSSVIDEECDLKIDELLSDDNSPKYYIGDISDFKSLPSRLSYYDTETKITDRYKRYDMVVSFIKLLGFESSSYNLGYEYEQTFTLIIDKYNLYTLRLRPNLFLRITPLDHKNVYDGYFNKSDIISYIRKTSPDETKSIIRDIIIDGLLDK